MAKKKKRAGVTKRAAARGKAPSRRKASRKRAASGRSNKVDLKALRGQVETNAARLREMSTRGINTEAVVSRLERMMADLDDLCDENNPDGCAPTMVFPLEA